MIAKPDFFRRQGVVILSPHMTAYTLPDDLHLLSSALSAQPNNTSANDTWRVVCYCAQWCDTCRDYAPAFKQLAQKWPNHVFVWVDIEENPELLGDEDVENFPTLLVQSGLGNHFFGPMLPHIGHLDKLLETAHRLPASDQGPPALTDLINAAKSP